MDFSNKSVVRKVKKTFTADSILPDPINEDAVYQARNAKTKKWGLYQQYREIIPAKYDSIKFFNSNDLYTFVWNDGKMGIGMLSSWEEGAKGYKQTVPCIYDEGKISKYWNRAEAVEQEYLKVRKGDKWGMIDWTGTILVEFLYDNYKDVKPPR